MHLMIAAVTSCCSEDTWLDQVSASAPVTGLSPAKPTTAGRLAHGKRENAGWLAYVAEPPDRKTSNRPVPIDGW